MQDLVACIHEFDSFPFNPASPTLRTLQSAIPATDQLVVDFNSAHATGKKKLISFLQDRMFSTAHLLASILGHIPCASFSIGQGIVSCPDQCHIVHISRVHKQLLLIQKDGEPARLHFAALVHCTLDPHIPGHVQIGVTRYGLSEVSKEGNLISRREVSIAQKLGSHLPYLLLSYATIHGSMARKELTY